MKLYSLLIFRLALDPNEHGLKMTVSATILFGPQFSFIQHFEQCNCSLYLVFCMTHSSWQSLSNGCMFLYSRTMLSDKQSEHSFSPTTFLVWSLLLKTLCCIRERAKSSLILSECFCYQFCLSSSQCFAMSALLQTSQKAFIESAG